MVSRVPAHQIHDPNQSKVDDATLERLFTTAKPIASPLVQAALTREAQEAAAGAVIDQALQVLNDLLPDEGSISDDETRKLFRNFSAHLQNTNNIPKKQIDRYVSDFTKSILLNWIDCIDSYCSENDNLLLDTSLLPINQQINDNFFGELNQTAAYYGICESTIRQFFSDFASKVVDGEKQVQLPLQLLIEPSRDGQNFRASHTRPDSSPASTSVRIRLTLHEIYERAGAWMSRPIIAAPLAASAFGALILTTVIPYYNQPSDKPEVLVLGFKYKDGLAIDTLSTTRKLISAFESTYGNRVLKLSEFETQLAPNLPSKGIYMAQHANQIAASHKVRFTLTGEFTPSDDEGIFKLNAVIFDSKTGNIWKATYDVEEGKASKNKHIFNDISTALKKLE